MTVNKPARHQKRLAKVLKSRAPVIGKGKHKVERYRSSAHSCTYLVLLRQGGQILDPVVAMQLGLKFPFLSYAISCINSCFGNKRTRGVSSAAIARPSFEACRAANMDPLSVTASRIAVLPLKAHQFCL